MILSWGFKNCAHSLPNLFFAQANTLGLKGCMETQLPIRLYLHWRIYRPHVTLLCTGSREEKKRRWDQPPATSNILPRGPMQSTSSLQVDGDVGSGLPCVSRVLLKSLVDGQSVSLRFSDVDGERIKSKTKIHFVAPKF